MFPNLKAEAAPVDIFSGSGSILDERKYNTCDLKTYFFLIISGF